MSHIDYKDLRTLRHFIDGFKRIKAKYYSGVCLRHQKALSAAIKLAREMALVPFVTVFKKG
jgi:small subunit ribosomal protein S18